MDEWKGNLSPDYDEEDDEDEAGGAGYDSCGDDYVVDEDGITRLASSPVSATTTATTSSSVSASASAAATSAGSPVEATSKTTARRPPQRRRRGAGHSLFSASSWSSSSEDDVDVHEHDQEQTGDATAASLSAVSPVAAGDDEEDAKVDSVLRSFTPAWPLSPPVTAPSPFAALLAGASGIARDIGGASESAMKSLGEECEEHAGPMEVLAALEAETAALAAEAERRAAVAARARALVATARREAEALEASEARALADQEATVAFRARVAAMEAARRYMDYEDGDTGSAAAAAAQGSEFVSAVGHALEQSEMEEGLSPLDLLPRDVWTDVLKRFEIPELARTMRSCRFFYVVGKTLMPPPLRLEWWRSATTRVDLRRLSNVVPDLLYSAQARRWAGGTETVELQIQLYHYDPMRSKRPYLNMVVPHETRTGVPNIMLFGDELVPAATELGLPCMTRAQLIAAQYRQRKKEVKRLGKRYDAFFAASGLVRQIPRLMGPMLNKLGKFPTVIDDSSVASVQRHLSNYMRTAKIVVRKVNCLNLRIGHTRLQPHELAENVLTFLQALAAAFPRPENVGRIYLKSTMGRAYRISLMDRRARMPYFFPCSPFREAYRPLRSYSAWSPSYSRYYGSWGSSGSSRYSYKDTLKPHSLWQGQPSEGYHYRGGPSSKKLPGGRSHGAYWKTNKYGNGRGLSFSRGGSAAGKGGRGNSGGKGGGKRRTTGARSVGGGRRGGGGGGGKGR